MKTKLTVWIITGKFNRRRFAYTGSHSTRKEAIHYHCKAKGYDWDECKRRSDRAQKATLTFEL